VDSEIVTEDNDIVWVGDPSEVNRQSTFWEVWMKPPPPNWKIFEYFYLSESQFCLHFRMQTLGRRTCIGRKVSLPTTHTDGAAYSATSLPSPRE